MIARIEGKIKLRGDRFLIIDTGGVGYKIFVPPKALRKTKKLDDTLGLWTHLHVRENSMELYGFAEYSELEFFETLIQISGIGPKSALGILAVAPLDTLKKAISFGETSYLTKVSGIGKKTAERVIVELRDKMGALDDASNSMFKEEQDVMEALRSLGYSPSEAREAVKQAPESIKGINARVKEALKILGGK